MNGSRVVCFLYISANDVTVDSVRKNLSHTNDASIPIAVPGPTSSHVFDREKWAAKSVDVKALMLDAETYMKSLKGVDQSCSSYKDVVDATELLRTSALPVDRHSAASFARDVAHFADIAWMFWQEQQDVMAESQVHGVKENAAPTSTKCTRIEWGGVVSSGPKQNPEAPPPPFRGTVKWEPAYEPYIVSWNPPRPPAPANSPGQFLWSN